MNNLIFDKKISLKIKFFFLILLSLLFIFLLFDIGNIDDKTFYFSTSQFQFFSSDSYDKLNDLKSVIPRTDSNIHLWRTKERISGVLNYSLVSISINFIFQFLKLFNLKSTGLICLSTTLGLILPHCIILSLFLYFFLKEKRKNHAKILFYFMYILIIIATLLGFLSVYHKLHWTYSFLSVGQIPLIYSPRGALGLLFCLQCYFYFTKKNKALLFSFIFLPLIHIGQGLILLGIFCFLFLIETLFQKKSFSKFLSMSIVPFILMTLCFCIIEKFYIADHLLFLPFNIISIFNYFSLVTTFSWLFFFFIVYYLGVSKYSRLTRLDKQVLNVYISLFLILQGLHFVGILSTSIQNSTLSQLYVRIFGNTCVPFYYTFIYCFYKSLFFKFRNKLITIGTYWQSINLKLYLSFLIVLSLFFNAVYPKLNARLTNSYFSLFHSLDAYQKSHNTYLYKISQKYTLETINPNDEVLFHLFLCDYFSNGKWSSKLKH